jgi:hypothetical protein
VKATSKLLSTTILFLILVGGFVAETISRVYQEKKLGYVDDKKARGWRNKVHYMAIAWLLIIAWYNLWLSGEERRCSPNFSENWSICASGVKP